MATEPAGHKLKITVEDDYGPSLELICPETGCPKGDDGRCILIDWVEAEGADLLHGSASVVVPVDVRWPYEEAPELHIIPFGPKDHGEGAEG